MEKVACSANSAKSAHLSNKWMPELESTCDLRSKTLFSTRSFTPEHRFAFDSRVPASSCVQYSRTAKLLVIESLRCSSQTNMSGIVFWTANRPKIPFPASIFHSEDRNMSVFCPFGLNWLISNWLISSQFSRFSRPDIPEIRIIPGPGCVIRIRG